LQALPNQQTVDYPSFKLVIVGDGGTGQFFFLFRAIKIKSYFFISFINDLGCYTLAYEIYGVFNILQERQPL